MSNNAIIKIKDLMAADFFSDLTITCGDKSFKVHKSILWIQSEYFRKLLGGKFKEANATTLDLSADDPAVLAVLIHYLYNFMIKEVIADLTGERRTKRESAGGAVQKRCARGRMTRGGGATRGQSTQGGGHGQGIQGGYHGQNGRGAGLGQGTRGGGYGQTGGRVGGGYGQTVGRGGRGNANRDERGTLTHFGYRDRDAA